MISWGKEIAYDSSPSKRGAAVGGQERRAVKASQSSATPQDSAGTRGEVPGGSRPMGSRDFTGSADEAYEAIRRSTTDVETIAKTTGIEPENIQKVKNYIFYVEHLS
jgi:hypothetical protein